MDNNISLYELYPAQQKTYDDPARFKILNKGRRTGKTILLIRAICDGILKGVPVAFYAFSDKTMDDTWDEVRDIFMDVTINGTPFISDKDERYKKFKCINGGSVEFWTAGRIRNGRGKKYGVVVCDEVAFYDYPEALIKETILPTLVDYDDSQLILASTPYGTGNYWYEICTNPPPHFKVFHGTLYQNPFISRANIDLLESITDPIIWQQEFLAQFVDIGAEKFMWNYDAKVHYIHGNVKLNDEYPVWLSFDFNYNPCTCTAFQALPNGVFATETFGIKGGTRLLCEMILTMSIGEVDVRMLKVTGDQSGASDSAVSGNVSNWDIVQEVLGLRDIQMINTRGRNKSHEYSRVICNDFLYKIPFWICAKAKELHFDMNKAKPDKNGKLYKDRTKGFGMDFLDNFRYFVAARFPNGLSDISDYLQDIRRKEN